jgi:hypothetical protein
LIVTWNAREPAVRCAGHLHVVVMNGKQCYETSYVVNKLQKFMIRPVPQGLFRILPAQPEEIVRLAIKSKLSGVS